MLPHTAVRRARRASADGEGKLALGDLSAAEQKFTSAFDRVRRKVGKDPAATEIAVRAHLGLGRICLARDDFRDADLRFGAVQRLRPNDGEGFYWAGCVAAHVGDFPRAEWYFGATLARDGQLSRAYLQRAYVRARQGRDELALVDLYAADRCRALDDRARLLIASLLLRRGYWPQAEAFVNSMSAAGRGPTAAAVLGLALQPQGKIEAACAAYEQAIAGGYRDDVVLLQHGLVAYRLGRFAASIDSWTVLRNRHPERTRFAELVATAHYARGVQLVAGHAFEAAIDHLQAAASGRPDGELDAAIAELRMHAAAQAIARRSTADRHQARRQLFASQKARPDDPRAPHYLAILEFIAGLPKNSLALWQRLRLIAPRDVRVRYGLVFCAIGLNDPADAEAELLDLLGSDAPEGIQRWAAHALAALDIRRGDWSTAIDMLTPLADDQWRASVLAECLYRTRQDTVLLALPDTAPRRPWQTMARLRAGSSQHPEATAVPGDDRVQRELALMLRDTALTEADNRNWARASALLTLSDELTPTTERQPVLIDALVRGLGGDRDTAIELLGDASRRAPTDHRLNHTAALMLLHTLSAQDAAVTSARWSDCIGAWTAVLHDDVFWADWRLGAERRYRKPVPATMLEPLRTSLRELVEQRIGAEETGNVPATLLLRREYDAARVLRELGGLPMVEPDGTRNGTQLVCGPLRIVELGLTYQLGRFAVEFSESPAKLKQLLRRFSHLGLAEVHLAAGRPAEALTLAMDLRCPTCRAAGPSQPEPRSAQADRPLQCQPDCAEFDRCNPAFTALPDKHGELVDGGTALAIEALLEIAKAVISASEMNVMKAAECWTRAVGHADRLGRRDDVRRAAVDTALGRAKALSQRADWDGAVAVLDAALGIVGSHESPDGERVTGRLATLLTTRGIDTVNKDKTKTKAGLDDLTRAVELNPHLVRARLNLAMLLRLMALDLLDKGDVQETMRLLRQSVEQFDRGLVDKPGDRELSEGRKKAATDLNAVFSALAGAYRGRRR